MDLPDGQWAYQLRLLGTKHCGNCQQEVPVDEFRHDRTRFDDLEGYCKLCRDLKNAEKVIIDRDCTCTPTIDDAYPGGVKHRPSCRYARAIATEIETRQAILDRGERIKRGVS